jgi:hypothetical protein
MDALLLKEDTIKTENTTDTDRTGMVGAEGIMPAKEDTIDIYTYI